MKKQLLAIGILLAFLACKEKDNKASDAPLDAIIETNTLENIKQATAKGNDGLAIANWFPESLLGYKLDEDKKDIGEGAQSRASAIYNHPENPEQNIFIEVWDGNGPATLAVKNMINLNLGETVEESTSQMRRKVYVRKGRKSVEREIYQNNQVNISFEVDGRFYATLRSDNNSLEILWQMADLLDFNMLN